MESNPNQTIFLKYDVLCMGLLFSIIIIANYLMGRPFVSKGELYELNVYDVATLLIIPVMVTMLGIYLKDKIVALKLEAQFLTISTGKVEEQIPWESVQRIRKLWFVQPPLYILRIKEEEGFYLFATGWFSINIAGFIWDPSDMSDYISRKRNEYGFE